MFSPAPLRKRGLGNAGGGGPVNAGGGGGPVNAGGGGGAPAAGGAPAELTYHVDKQLINAFFRVIESKNITPGVCQAIIIQLQANRAELEVNVCTDAAKNLETIYVESNDVGGQRMDIRIDHNSVIKIGGGTYGTILLDTETGKVYKRIKYNRSRATMEKFHRELFMEAFIQTVLQNDPVYGRNIGQIVKVYRHMSVVRSGKRPKKIRMIHNLVMK